MRRQVAASVALLLTMMGTTVYAAPAHAGDANDSGRLQAALYNVTPYTMTLVAASSDHGFDGPPTTIPPGGAIVYTMNGSDVEEGGICIGTWRNSYNGYMTYRVDVLGGPVEYVTLSIHGTRSHSTAVGCLGFADPNDVYPAMDVWNTPTAPPPGWNPSGALWTLPNVNEQVTFQHNVPYPLDQTFGIAGDWSADASTPLGRGLDEALNAICGANQASCDFTQTGPLTWGIGAPVPKGQDINCPGDAKGDAYFSVGYGATTEATLSVGAGVEASTEVKLFNVIGSKITASVEAQHEWKEEDSFDRDAKVYIPDGYSGAIWTAPTIGQVTGTMKLRSGTSTFTLTNFRQVRSGVTRDDQTPAFDAITQVRPATAAELTRFCPGYTPPAGTAGAAADSAAGVPRLVPGRGVGPLKLGRVRDARLLGRPALRAPLANRSATANDCTALDQRCAMAPGRGTWAYDDTSVIFGADRRVSALIYSGAARTAKGIGVGSRLRAVREAYSRVSCTSEPGATNCTLAGKDRAGPVRTVFHLTRKKGRVVVDRVMIYRVDTTRGGWGA